MLYHLNAFRLCLKKCGWCFLLDVSILVQFGHFLFMQLSLAFGCLCKSLCCSSLKPLVQCVCRGEQHAVSEVGKEKAAALL